MVTTPDTADTSASARPLHGDRWPVLGGWQAIVLSAAVATALNLLIFLAGHLAGAS